jgi:cellulose biosynthesis protein BcsQ
MPLLNDAIHSSDAIIIVVQASHKDLESQGAAEGLIKKAGKEGRVVYVINRVDSRSTLVQNAVETLKLKGARPPVLIGDRVEYVRADAMGKAANELTDRARLEIRALWTAVQGVL